MEEPTHERGAEYHLDGFVQYCITDGMGLISVHGSVLCVHYYKTSCVLCSPSNFWEIRMSALSQIRSATESLIVIIYSNCEGCGFLKMKGNTKVRRAQNSPVNTKNPVVAALCVAQYSPIGFPTSEIISP